MSQVQVSYLGLGNMGGGMAKNIVLKAQLDKPVLLFNRSSWRAEKLVSQLPKSRAQVAQSIESAVEPADIIFMSLSDDTAVEDTITAALKLDIRGKIFVDNSTIARQSSAKISEMVHAAGAGFVACPVFGSPLMAENGQLVCLPAGPKEFVDKVRPFCEGVIGRAVIDFSDHAVGDALAMKAIGNSLLFNAIEALSEGHMLAEKSGVGREPFHRFVDLFFMPYVPYSERMMNGVYYTSEHPPFSVDHARKDIRYAKELGTSFGVPLKGLEVADAHYAAVQEHMDGSKADVSSIYGAIRKESGLKFEIE